MSTVVAPEQMTITQLEEWIELLTDARTLMRKQRQPTTDITVTLDGAWDLLRRRRAEAVYGPTEVIARRARVEREIEKLGVA